MGVREGLEVYRSHPVRASWKIPALFCNDWGALRLLEICSELGVDRPFDIVYGAPHSAWSGGRPSAVREQLDEERLRRQFQAYRYFGVRCALTLSRLQVEKAAYGDAYCNLLLRLAQEYGGEVILFDDGLAAYIKQKHPELKVIASLNKAMSDLQPGIPEETAYYRKLLELYDEVVIRSEYAMRDDCMQNLSDVADRVEVIVNQFCKPNCPCVYRHVKDLQDWSDRGCVGEGQPCYHLAEASDIRRRLEDNLFISDGRIAELCEAGFTRMKIAGRNSPLPMLLDSLADYLFEPTGAISHIKRAIVREFKQEAAIGRGAVAPWSIPRSVQALSRP